MKITTCIERNVKRSGLLKEGGYVETRGRILRSDPNSKGGCEMNGCNCSPGHWINITLPWKADKTVEWITVHFDSKKELDKFISGREILQSA